MSVIKIALLLIASLFNGLFTTSEIVIISTIGHLWEDKCMYYFIVCLTCCIVVNFLLTVTNIIQAYLIYLESKYKTLLLPVVLVIIIFKIVVDSWSIHLTLAQNIDVDLGSCSSYVRSVTPDLYAVILGEAVVLLISLTALIFIGIIWFLICRETRSTV